MWFAPRVRAGEWEDHAPDITLSGKAGRWTEAKMVRLLTTGKEAEAPMPAYRLSPEDARAVAAYLRSVPGRKEGDRKEDERDRRRKGRDDD
jgi:mono/diheme cytochrome c family protein